MVSLKQLLMESTQTKFEQTKLGHAYKDYEPGFDSETMRIHYSKHYKGYTDKLNDAIKDENITVTMGNDMSGIKSILGTASKYSDKLKNNAGGFFNHTFFFNGLNPEDKGKLFDTEFEQAIIDQYKSIDKYKEAFTEAALNHFGDGWCWLMFDKGQLTITTTDKQDNPYMDTINIPGRIIMALDLWEHSYYLKYKNDREKYINGYWKLACWNMAAKRYLKAVDALNH